MVRFNLGRLPAALSQISMPNLVALLRPHESFLRSKEIPLGERLSPEAYERLLAVLTDPLSGAPFSLLAELQLIQEMSGPDAMDLLLDEAARRGVPMRGFPDPTPADVAAQLLGTHPRLVERVHGQRFVAQGRQFTFFRCPQRNLWEAIQPPERAAGAIEADLEEAFADHSRGRGVRVSVFDAGDGIEYLIRRGGAVRRQIGVRESGARTSVVFRPERYDVVLFFPGTGEIGISAETAADQRVYRRAFGLALVGDEAAFVAREKFTFAPILRDDARTLATEDCEDLEWARLTELTVKGSGPGEVHIQRGTNLLPASRHLKSLLNIGRAVSAQFELKFAGVRHPARLSILSGNLAEYPLASDPAIVDEWLRRRGFVRPTA